MLPLTTRRFGIALALLLAVAAPLLTGCGESKGRPTPRRNLVQRPRPGHRAPTGPTRPDLTGPGYTPPSRPTERMCFGCRGTGSIGPFGNPYSGAGYKPATSCPSCGGSGRVRN